MRRELHSVAPISARFADHLAQAADRFGIVTRDQITQWLAQLAHESGGFIYTKELWGPTSAQKRYERDFTAPWPASIEQSREAKFKANKLAYGLGNKIQGDGKRFMGRGLIQITGRTNYAACSQALYGDTRLIDNPELLQEPEAAALSAGWYWSMRKLNKLADAGDFVGITIAINGATNGLDDRAKWLRKFQEAFA